MNGNDTMKRHIANWAVTVLLVSGMTSADAAERVVARGGVPVISGGVGSDSEQYLKSQESSFNLKFVCALQNGDYIAGVAVTVTDEAGKQLVDTTADGPIFMARLPAGKYTVVLSYQGQSQIRRVMVRAGALQTEYVRWKNDAP